MSNSNKITNNDLKQLGFSRPDQLKTFGKLLKRAMRAGQLKKIEILEDVKKIINSPEDYFTHKYYSAIARTLAGAKKLKTFPNPGSLTELLPQPIDYKIYGEQAIEHEALEQMRRAMSLPVTKAGALMPDAHTGYGLPIGGVLATRGDVVIPYAVGVDIACRMCMSIFQINSEDLAQRKSEFIKLLNDHTIFGVGETNKKHLNTDLFDQPEWKSTTLIRKFSNLAYSQLGTSGAGNHFAEWGILYVEHSSEILDLRLGAYIALLSHSGSRGFGNEIATFYSRLAMEINKLPNEAKHLAWLSLASQEGHEYWLAMNLAGQYASANHHEIHNKISRSLGVKPVLRVENHHNFAWKDHLPDGTPVIIHRKGSTPAGKDDIGIIPGSMATPGFIIQGKGNPLSLSSASHGAGRTMSRTKALQSFSREMLNDILKEKGVELIGGDIDESPMAYKDIHEVMQAQEELVTILARFNPKIVMMAKPEKWHQKYRDD